MITDRTLISENAELNYRVANLQKELDQLKEDIDWILAVDPCCPNKTEYGMKVWNRISELQYGQPHWLNWEKKKDEPWTRSDDLEMM